MDLSPEMIQLGLGAIAAVSVAAFIYILASPYLSGQLNQDRLRVPAHAVARELCRAS